MAISAIEVTTRYDEQAGTWTELTRDLNLLHAGVVGDELVVGSVSSDAGRLLAAYDPEADRLLISDDVCLSGHYPTIATEDRLWSYVYDPDALAYESFDLVLD